MIKSIKIRLNPNNKQNTLMFQSSGTSRWAYNWALSRQDENYKNGGKFISNNDLRKELTQLKKTDELKWLFHYSNNITKQAVKDACDAYIDFFKNKTKHPRYKSRKKSKPSFYHDTDKIKFNHTHVKLEKIGWIRLCEHGKIPINAKYSNPRITFDGVNWFISVGIECVPDKTELTGESVGIDLGLKVMAVTSNMDMPYKNINKTKRIKMIKRKMRRLQHRVSVKYLKNKKGGSYYKTCNIIKLEKRIAKTHRKLDNIRTDYRHKITTEIVKTKPSRIVMENLNVSGMMKNKHLSKAISEQCFYEFKMVVKYKSELFGIEFVEADRWYPSSKTCGCCGYIKPKLSLSERTFTCELCETEIDRDKNAAINLSRYRAS